MKFTPKSEEDIQKEGLMPAGIYPFTVLEAVDTVSKASGNEMIKIKLAVYDNEGRERHLYDYLLESMAAKFRHFCVQTGMEGRYQDGSVAAEHCEGKDGYVKIKIGKAKGDFPAKNEVDDYVAKPDNAAPTGQRSDADRLKKPGTGVDDSGDDEIPF